MNLFRNIKKKNYFLVFSLMIICELYLIYFLRGNVNYYINADDSSEMILGNILANENNLLTTSWYYSTEIRLLDTNLIFMPLFKVFSSWRHIRLATAVILHILLLISNYYLMKKMNCRELFPYASLALIIPFSVEYFNYTLLTGNYIPHMMVSIIGLGLTFSYIDKRQKSKKIIAIIAGVLALLGCMSTGRSLIFMYLPLLCSALLLTFNSLIQFDIKKLKNDKYFDFLKIAFISFVFACIGYVINSKILSSHYYFRVWDDRYFQLFSFEMIIRVINGFLETYGYVVGNVTFKKLISNGIAIGFLGLSMIAMVYGLRTNKQEQKEYHILATFYFTNILIYSVMYAFTSMTFYPRYNQLIIIFSFILIVLYFKYVNWLEVQKKVAQYSYIVMLLLSGLLTYQTMIPMVENTDRISIANKLVQEGYYVGYGTFWNGNILTEFSNGEIDMYVWTDEEIEDINDINQWLQRTDHVDTVPNNQKVFIILNKNQVDNFKWKNNLQENDLVIETSYYYVYGYQNYESMISILYS